MDHESRNSYSLETEDRARMNRLYEEIQGRLTEMGLIVCRVLELDPSDMQFKFAPTPMDSQSTEEPKALRFKGIEIVCGPSGCGCYDHDAGDCFPC